MLRAPARSTRFPYTTLFRSDERTPPLLFHQGEGFRLERLPLGSRVVYPPESLPGIKDVDAAIDRALDRKSTRLNSSHANTSYAVFCLKKKKNRHLDEIDLHR